MGSLELNHRVGSMMSIGAQLVMDLHLVSAHVAGGCAYSKISRKHFDATVLSTGST